MKSRARWTFAVAVVLALAVAAGSFAAPDGPPQRRLRPFDADTLWVAGGAEDDTTLLIPIAGAVGEEAIYVIDRGGPRVAAFARADGSLRWIRGRRGAGPGELMNPTALGVAADGTVLIVDARNARIARLGPGGDWLPSLPLRDVSYVSGLCVLTGDTLLLTTMADSAPVLILAPDGTAERRPLPWPDLAGAAGLVVQTALAASPDVRDCYLGLYLGRGFARWRDGRFQATAPYIESFDLPAARVSATGNRTMTRLSDSRVALGDVAVTDSTVVFLFRGMSEHGSRVLDVYARDGAYRYSFRFEAAMVGVDYAHDTFYLRSSPGGRPAIHAVRIRPR